MICNILDISIDGLPGLRKHRTKKEKEVDEEKKEDDAEPIGPTTGAGITKNSILIDGNVSKKNYYLKHT